MINDCHCHFFSKRFFEKLAGPEGSGRQITDQLAWDFPGTPEDLADRWIEELDGHQVGRAALIASVPGDERSVAAAVNRYPRRFVGFFMVDPTAPQAPQRVEEALKALGLRCVCLFPAMQRFSLNDDRTLLILEAAASKPGAAVFVHCGVLSVGVRKKLGLPSRFDMRYSNPLDLHAVALAFPQLPIIVPHFGAGFFREALMLADLCSNVYLDTSSSNSWVKYNPGLSLEAVFDQALRVAGPDRLLFGTDSSFFPRGWQRPLFEEQQKILGQLGLSDAEREKIFRINFDGLFPI
ncbi:MAG: amidohydrolase family protein [Acidobacteriota bacterium]